MELHQVYLLLGSNIGDRIGHILNGLNKIGEKAGVINAISSFYETEPWGVTDQADYLNAAVLISTEVEPGSLFAILKEIETGEGRLDQKKYAPRTLDIDILFYDAEIITTEKLTIPHPRLHLRKFVLIPMAEIAPDHMHPVINKTIEELIAECPDMMEVRRFGVKY